MSGSLLFVSTLLNVEPVPPPVLADPTGSRVCRRAMLAASPLSGWIRPVCVCVRATARDAAALEANEAG